MTTQVDPIGNGSAITEPEQGKPRSGQPTPFFVRQWNNLIHLVFDVQAAAAAALAAQTTANTVANRILTAGVGLSGGGNLTADRTFDLEDTAVTPATYGDSTHVGQLTVDQQGRLTAVSSVAIAFPAAITIKDEGSTLTATPSVLNFVGAGVAATESSGNVTVTIPGGASGTAATFSGSCVSTATISCAAAGNVFTPSVAMSVLGLGLVTQTVNGATYKLGIAPYNTGTNKITSAPTYAPTYTEAGAGTAIRAPFVDFAAAVVLAAGTSYVMFFVRTDSTSSVSQTPNYANAHQQGPGMYLATTAAVTAFQLASLAPTTSDTWTSSAGGVWAFQMTYTL